MIRRTLAVLATAAALAACAPKQPVTGHAGANPVSSQCPDSTHSRGDDGPCRAQ